MTTIAIDASPLTGPVTGIPRYIRELAPALVRLSAPERFVALGRGPLDLPGVEVIASNAPLWRTAWLPWTLLRQRAALVHFPYACRPPWLPCPNVVTVHDMAFLRNPAWFTPEMADLLRRTWLPAIRRADHVICDSEFTRRETAELLGVPIERMTAVLLGVGTAWLETTTLPHPNQGRPYIVAVGTRQPRKNYPRLIEAFAAAGERLAGYDLAIIGHQGWGGEDLMGIADRYGVADHLRLPDGVSDEELRAWYQHARAAAVVSLYEGFGLPVIEAMAQGVPCLASSTTSLPEAAGDAALLVNPTDPEAITNGLVRLCEDEDLRARLRDAGLARAREFTWERCAGETLEVYRKVIRGG